MKVLPGGGGVVIRGEMCLLHKSTICLTKTSGTNSINKARRLAVSALIFN